MRNLIKNLTRSCYLLLIIFIGGCQEGFLEVNPKATLSSNNLSTEAGVNGVLIGAYSLLNNGGTPGGGWPSGRWIFGGVTSDDAHTGTEAGALQPVPQYESYTHTAATPGFNDRWRVLYSSVQRANDVLRLLQQVVENGTIQPENALQIEAEAKFLRGVYHLEAALMWKNIPFIDEGISFANNNYNVSNTDPVWPFIEADFEFAGNHLTDTKSEVGRANKWAAKSFLVKAYMFQHKFNEAKPILDDIITNGVTANGLKYDLHKYYFDNFKPSTKHGPEQVFAVMHSVNDGAGGANGNTSSGEGHAGPYGGPFPSFGFYQPSFSLVNSYKTDEQTGLPLLENFNDFDIDHDLGIPSSEPFTNYQGTLDSRLDWIVGRRGIPFLDWGVNPGMSWVRQQSVGGPYLHMKNANPQAEPAARQNNSSANNYNMIRFADVLLWAAEVEVEIGSLELAEQYVNRIRARAANPEGWVKKYLDNDNPMAGVTDEPAANYKVGLYNGEFTDRGINFAREAVRFERKLELAMEHHRFFDLQRYDNGTGYMADLLNAYIQHETSVPNYNFYYMEGASFTKGKNELYPIPLEQIDLGITSEGPSLIQNPGY